MRRPNTTTRRTPLAASRLGNARACARHVYVLVQEACSHNVYRIHVPMHVNSMHGHMYVSRRSKVKRADARASCAWTRDETTFYDNLVQIQVSRHGILAF